MSPLNPRHRLDLRTRDMLYAIPACLFAGSGQQRAGALAASWSQEGVACRSLRSAFDLLLGAAAPPAGSEVLMSAITHPDMVRIATTHGLSVLRSISIPDPVSRAVQNGASRTRTGDLLGAITPQRGLLALIRLAQAVSG